MHVSWLGQTCVRLQTKHQGEDVTILIDPYRPKQGDFPRNFSPTVALFSAGQEGAATLSQQPLVIDTLGEFELKEVMITAFPGSQGGLLFAVVAEGITVVHLGRLAAKIDPASLEKLGHIDLLFVPAGNGEGYLPLAEAVDLVTALEPRAVIPLGYQCDTEPAAKPVAAFNKELGLKPDLTDKKIILKKKDLPQAEMKLYILEKT